MDVIGIVRWIARSTATEPEGVDEAGGVWTVEVQAAARSRSDIA
jgi:hypothetical protein